MNVRLMIWSATFAISTAALGASVGLRPAAVALSARAQLSPDVIGRIVAEIREGDRLAAAGDVDGARLRWSAARVTGRGWWPVHRWVASSYSTANMRSEAEAEYAVALALSGGAEPDERLAIHLERAANLEAMGRHTHALAALLDTSDARVLPELERIASRDPQLAGRLRQRAAERPDLWQCVANASEKTGQHRDAALAFAQHATVFAPSDREAVTNAVDRLERKQMLSEAAAVCRAHLAFSREPATMYLRIGDFLKRAGHIDEAATAYTSLVDLQPQSAEAHRQLASLLAGLHRYEQALDELAVVRQLKPDCVVADDVQSLVRRASSPVSERILARARELGLMER